MRGCVFGRGAGQMCADAGGRGRIVSLKDLGISGDRDCTTWTMKSLILLLAQVNLGSAWKLNESYVGSSSCWQLTPPPNNHIH